MFIIQTMQKGFCFNGYKQFRKKYKLNKATFVSLIFVN